MNLRGVESMYIIWDAKASPVAKYLVDSIDGWNHIILDDLKPSPSINIYNKKV